MDGMLGWMVLASVICSIAQPGKPWGEAAFPSSPAEQPHTATEAVTELPATAVPPQVPAGQPQQSSQETRG